MAIVPSNIKTLVVKIGTALLSGEQGFDGRVMEAMVKELAQLKQERQINVLVVSSGAIGCGMGILGMRERPKLLSLKQAVAAVGQSRLMHYYEVLFETHGNGLKTAQVLLTAQDLTMRETYLNVRNTITSLFAFQNVIPIVNENDSTAPSEVRFGDNDTLAARIAAKIDASLLIILSDVDGLYDKNPQDYPSATLIEHVDHVTEDLEAMAGDTVRQVSTGGMRTKIQAAKIARKAGVTTALANGRRPNIIHDILAGTAVCTVFSPARESISHRKRWIAFGRTSSGILRVDDGARRALVEQGRSLLAAGVVEVCGCFDYGAVVTISDSRGKDIARGVVNYSSDDLMRIKGHRSTEIEQILGTKVNDEVIHRDNLVILSEA